VVLSFGRSQAGTDTRIGTKDNHNNNCFTFVDLEGQRRGRVTISDSINIAAILSFLWRPAISLGAGAAHQRGPFSVAQAVSLQEGLDGLLVVDNSERARPVGAPQDAFTPARSESLARD